jgi:hypothetical protein
MQRRVIAALAAAWLLGGVAAAQTTPDLSGYWELSFDSRRVPSADLAPGVTPAAMAAQAAKDAHAVRWCNFLGLPAAMDSPRPINIRQGRREVLINFETVAAPRHLYFRAGHADPDVFDPTTSGDSIARWEGETLVVDTVGFDGAKGVTAIPGGGFRTSASRLVERYRLLNDGSVLSVTFTWTDPAVFRTPHTYEFRYLRAPRLYEAQAPLACNPFDEGRTRFLTEAKTR